MLNMRFFLFVSISLFSLQAPGYVHGRASEGGHFLLYVQEERTQFTRCGADPISNVESRSLAEALVECEKGAKRTTVTGVKGSASYAMPLAEYQKSLASLYGVSSSYFRKANYYQLLTSLAQGQEKRFRREPDAPLSDEECMRAESVRLLLRAHEELLQYVDSPESGLDLTLPEGNSKKLNYLVLSALTPTFSDGLVAYRVLPQFKETWLEDGCAQTFDPSWTPASVDTLMGTAIVPEEYEELEQFVRQQLMLAPQAATPQLLAWQAWYAPTGKVNLGTPQYQNTQGYFAFSFQPAAKTWVFQNGPKIDGIIGRMSIPADVLKYPGYGAFFQRVSSPAPLPLLCTRGVKSLQDPPALEPGEISAAFLVQRYRVSERSLYRHIVGCPILEEKLAPLFLDKSLGMSLKAFEEVGVHLENHLGVRVPAYQPALPEKN